MCLPFIPQTLLTLPSFSTIMKTVWTWRHILLTAIIVMTFVLASNGVLYWQLTEQFNTRMDILTNTTQEQAQLLQSQIESDRLYADQQRLMMQAAIENQLTEETQLLENKLALLSTDVLELREESQSNLQSVQSQLEERISSLAAGSDFSQIFEQVKPAVVSVRTNFGQASGFFFDEDGYVMTNRHVIDGARAIVVVDYEGQIYSASLLGTATTADLAVLKVDSNQEFEYLQFAAGSDIRAGQRVIAVGNPLGLSFSVTEGIISATERVIDSTNVGFIQTDVPINQGNSGGPLVNSQGDVVGVNTLKLASTEGLGFAIPSYLAKDIADQALVSS